ncbi:uncharacterized protein [Drosophila virilis]|uniref:uncharacterized protein n=1 Tax=Drosophila virilis TaxID=7244 RepID=UPI0038B25571
MFHQVKVRREGQAAQKFLWRDGDSSRSPETYVMQVMTFGAYCSPALANYFKNRNTERFVAEHPDAVKAICENTFVDDWLQSVDSESQMKQLAETVKRKGDAPLDIKFKASYAGAGRRLDESQKKVLGLWWLPGQDLLTFVVKPNLLSKAAKERPTNRCVLSVVMSMFDPLGLLGFGWDDDLTQEDDVDWRHWLDLVSKMNSIRIPRCMNLAASKARVPPLKPVFIPRMELMAAVLGLRLAKCIKNEMSLRIYRRTFWTDSRDVLYWMHSDARKLQQFVSLRIGEILEESDVETWRLVPSTQNMAADGTKWTKAPEIHGSTDDSGNLRIKGRIDNIGVERSLQCLSSVPYTMRLPKASRDERPANRTIIALYSAVHIYRSGLLWTTLSLVVYIGPYDIVV